MKTKDIVCAVICMDQRLLIAKRSSGVHENIWEFPGGKVESGETREQAVAREIREELELCVDIDRYLTTIRDNREDCTLLELYSYQFEAADQPILDMLQENTL